MRAGKCHIHRSTSSIHFKNTPQKVSGIFPLRKLFRLFRKKSIACAYQKNPPCGGNLLLNECYYFCKNLWITNREIRKGLSVDLYVLEIEHVDELRIGESKSSNGWIDTNVPKSSESSLLSSSVDVRIGTSFGDSILNSWKYISIH